jgi:hypothetical protein
MEFAEAVELIRVRLKPGDTVVVRVPGTLSAEQSQMIREQVRGVFEGYPVLVLSRGMSIEAVEVPEASCRG